MPTVNKFAVAFCLSVTAFQAAATDWSSFQDCASRHYSDVELAIPSISEGAKFIIGDLCDDEAAMLQFEIFKAYPADAVALIGDQKAIDQASLVISKEVRIQLFQMRKMRMGL